MVRVCSCTVLSVSFRLVSLMCVLQLCRIFKYIVNPYRVGSCFVSCIAFLNYVIVCSVIFCSFRLCSFRDDPVCELRVFVYVRCSLVHAFFALFNLCCSTCLLLFHVLSLLSAVLLSFRFASCHLLYFRCSFPLRFV